MHSVFLGGIIIMGLVSSLALYQKVATIIDDRNYPPTGQLVDIGGYKLHLHATGEGNVTVVCDAGLSGTSLGWSLVQAEVSKFARVCSYDRAGYAWSDPSPLERTSVNIANELHLLLEKAHIPGPYILVGHSFGGANVLVFADLYPEETMGVILVDSVQEDMMKELPDSAGSFLDNPHFQWFLAVLGLKRLKGTSPEIEKMFEPLPAKMSAAYIAQMNKTRYTETVNKESAYFIKSLAQLEERKIHLNQPLTVITARCDPNSEEDRIWKVLQERLLLKSHQSMQMMAENSDHMINIHQPEVIVQAIRDMIHDQPL